MTISVISRLRNWLYDSRVRDVNVDDESMLELHAAILAEKPMLRSTFSSFYDTMLECNERYLSGDGMEIELSSGVGFFKERWPEVVTSDVRYSTHIDRVLDAQNMDVPDNSVRCVYAINVFHHLPDPNRFFSELSRVLVEGGGCILIEPHNGLASATLHRFLHKDERFEPGEAAWCNQHIAGPLSGANQALAHIVFTRDLFAFKAQYGKELKLVHQGYVLNGIRYLLSGGLNFRQLAPSFLIPIICVIERLLFPVSRFWSLHQVIVIRKTRSAGNLK